MLKDILQYASEATGIANTNAATRAQLLRYINRAGRELYEKYDLPGSVLEISACVDNTDGQVTLPYYVDQIRAARRSTSNQVIKLHDIRPRYHETPWRQNLLEWRIKKRVALHTPLSVESQLTFTIAEAQSETIQFVVAGQTANAGFKEETLTLEAGQTTVTTTTQWAKEEPFGIERITKSVITTCDVVVTQTTNNVEVSMLSSRSTSAVFVLVQLNDWVGTYDGEDTCVELLFKRPYTELYYDHDIFIDPKLEDALVWKVRAHFASLSADPNVVMLAPGYSASSEDLVRAVLQNQSKETEQEMSFTTPGSERAWVYGARYRRKYYR